MTDTLTTPTPCPTRCPVVLPVADWTARQDAHTVAADALTAGHRERRGTGERHPVWDFLFSYYPVRPAQLRRWTPGVGVGLSLDGLPEDAALPGPAKFHHRIPTEAGEVWTVDTDAFFAARGRAVTFIRQLLSATAGRTPRFTCFGMHEWAMVYRGTPRHPEPLRLGAEATDRVVEEGTLSCTHFDAFRFFTPDAVPRNACALTRESQVASEQPGCLHATMDLYKWATKLGPLVPGELWLDTFRLACEVRATDMEASPYDLRAWGHRPVPVETAAGRSEYARRQKGFAARGQRLRRRLLDLVDTAYPDLAAGGSPAPAGAGDPVAAGVVGAGEMS